MEKEKLLQAAIDEAVKLKASNKQLADALENSLKAIQIAAMFNKSQELKRIAENFKSLIEKHKNLTL